MLLADSTGLATTDDWVISPGSLVRTDCERADSEAGELKVI
jgi:hypothetical protein